MAHPVVERADGLGSKERMPARSGRSIMANLCLAWQENNVSILN